MWRQNHPLGSRRIPEELWRIAAKLSKVSSVHKVSKLLSLDFRKLKARAGLLDASDEASVLETSDLPANPHEALTEASSRPRHSSSTINDKTPDEHCGKYKILSSEPTPLTGFKQNHCSVKPSDKEKLDISGDGFIEALRIFDCSEKPDQTARVLAQIRSPGGYVLELYSGTTNSIIEAFVRS